MKKLWYSLPALDPLKVFRWIGGSHPEADLSFVAAPLQLGAVGLGCEESLQEVIENHGNQHVRELLCGHYGGWGWNSLMAVI